MSSATTEVEIPFRFPTLGNHMGVGFPIQPHPSIYETIEVRLDMPITPEDEKKNVVKKTQIINSSWVDHVRDRHWSFGREKARADRIIREQRGAEARKAAQRSERAKKAAVTRAANKAAKGG